MTENESLPEMEDKKRQKKKLRTKSEYLPIHMTRDIINSKFFVNII